MAQQPPKNRRNAETSGRTSAPKTKTPNANNRKPTDDGKKHTRTGAASTFFLTFLLIIAFIIVGCGVVFILWNNRHSNPESVSQNFYPKASSQVIANGTDASSSSTSGTSTSSSSGKTYTIAAGDNTDLIATKVSQQLGKTLTWSDIVQLNQTGSPATTLDPNNAGKYMDGNWIKAGQTLTIAK
ncbi:MAG: LysM peptidoglycan-binding domain-containing protein [Streptococcaceae bacterium]|jgi:nucleoid-associated protein YgaU|nr:LysM peptidoglycan-binding domain-containing protein [Streptococcaceae bacterium]